VSLTQYWEAKWYRDRFLCHRFQDSSRWFFIWHKVLDGTSPISETRGLSLLKGGMLKTRCRFWHRMERSMFGICCLWQRNSVHSILFIGPLGGCTEATQLVGSTDGFQSAVASKIWSRLGTNHSFPKWDASAAKSFSATWIGCSMTSTVCVWRLSNLLCYSLCTAATSEQKSLTWSRLDEFASGWWNIQIGLLYSTQTKIEKLQISFFLKTSSKYILEIRFYWVLLVSFRMTYSDKLAWTVATVLG
jgi:hypothetical protein